MPLDIEEIKTEKLKTPYGKSVRIYTDEIALNGELSCPENEAGIIIFSQDNRDNGTFKDPIINIFNKNKLATLVPDFSSYLEETERSAHLQAKELGHTTLWARKNPETANLHLGYFAEGSGVAAALIAAARYPDTVQAVVVRGGRPDQALEYLPQIKAPVLLIAGGRDPSSRRSHQRVLEELYGHVTLNVIPDASQSFMEPGVAEEAAQLAALWFLQHLG